MEPQNSIEITSEKYNIAGRIDDYGFVIKLCFVYRDREYVIGINRSFDEELADKGKEVMEEAIERLSK